MMVWTPGMTPPGLTGDSRWDAAASWFLLLLVFVAVGRVSSW